jgi:hypothetical protein
VVVPVEDAVEAKGMPEAKSGSLLTYSTLRHSFTVHTKCVDRFAIEVFYNEADSLDGYLIEETEVYMKFIRPRRHRDSMIILSAAVLLLQVPIAAQSPGTIDRGYMYIEGGGAAGEPKDVQIGRALAAGPGTVTAGARIVGVDSQGKSIVLREGNNGFTCQPGNPKVVGRPASCANEAALL